MTRTLRSRRPMAATRTLRSRRLALVAAATVTLSFVAGACGSEATPVGEVATSSTVGPSTTLAPQVIVVSGSPSGSGAALPASASDASGEVMDTKMMAALIHYTYEGGVPDLTGPAPSWYFPAGATASESDMLAVAAALGIDGEPVALPENEGGGWRIGPPNYSDPVVTFGTDAMQSWWYSAPIIPTEDCAYYPPGDPSGDATTADLPNCDEIPPPANVPDEATAEAKAADLFAAVGMDPSLYELEAYADEWSASVTAYLKVDGMKTWATASVGFGGEGAVTWASGFLAEPVRGGDYERIGVQAVIDRLNEQSASWWRGGVLIDEASDIATATAGEAMAEPVAADEAPAAPIDSTGTDVVLPVDTRVEPSETTPPSPTVDTVLIDPMPVDTVLIDPMPVDTAPELIEPETIEVTVTDATPSLEMIYAADGTVWLLPGYRFTTSDGAEITAPAVPDEYLQYDEATPLPVDEPIPVGEPIPVDSIELPVDLSIPIVPTGGADAAPTADAGAGTSGSDGPLCAGLPTSMETPTIDLSLSKILVGMCLDEATALVEGITDGAALRVVRDDGVDLAVTADYSETRVNVAVDGGVITEVVSIG